MNVSYLCLGGNIGDRERSVQQALLLISEKAGKIKAVSPVYETEAWGVENQQAYLNLCLELHTELSSSVLLQILLSIEKELGRERTGSAVYESRTIDIDILFFNNDVINSTMLIVPHPRLHLRKFVLIPLNDIAPNYLHPVLNTTIFNLLNQCPDTSRVKLYN